MSKSTMTIEKAADICTQIDEINAEDGETDPQMRELTRLFKANVTMHTGFVAQGKTDDEALGEIADFHQKQHAKDTMNIISKKFNKATLNAKKNTTPAIGR